MTWRILTRRFLAFFVLLTLLCTARDAAAWQCEGRQCGVTPWLCCCEAPAHDCDDQRSEEDTTTVALSDCPSECGCTVVITPGSAFSVTAIATSVVFPPVLYTTTAPAAYQPFVFNPLTVAHDLEPRGPPLRVASLPLSPLRGPPVA